MLTSTKSKIEELEAKVGSDWLPIAELIAAYVAENFRHSKHQPVDSAWLSPSQAAQYIGTTETTLTAWRKRRCGPVFSRRGNLVRYSPADLDEFMREAKVDVDAES